MKICIFGAASYDINENYIKTVEQLGMALAKRGHSLVFGAGKNGLMGAAARGVSSQNGEIFGVIPEFFKEDKIEVIYQNCTELIYTKTMAERKAKMEDLADAFIIVPGGIGTFEEFFEVLTLKQLGRHEKPIAVFDIDCYYKKLEEFLNFSISQKFINESCKDLYCYTNSAEEVISYIENDDGVEYSVHELKKG